MVFPLGEVGVKSHETDARTRGGKDEAPSLLALYHEYKGLVRSVLFRICGPCDLDDLVQDTFVRIWQGLDRFRRQASLRTWIYRIAVNTALDSHRKNKRRKLEIVWSPEEADGENRTGDQVNRDLVRKGLASLSVPHRTVLVLHTLEGLSVEEIAEVLGAWKGTVKSRLFYARKAMLKFLDENGVKL